MDYGVLTEEERRTMLILMESREPTEVASAWEDYLRRDEAEARQDSFEFERYRTNLYKCLEKLISRNNLGYAAG